MFPEIHWPKKDSKGARLTGADADEDQVIGQVVRLSP